MTTLSALLASLPPPSLAETDFARFAAQALGRRARGELPGLARQFAEESLRGYPTSIGPILQALIETMMQQGIDPAALDSRAVDQLLGSAAMLARLEERLTVERQRLRPGTVIHPALRQTLGTRLLMLPGVGQELVLVAPVDLARVADAHFAVPLGVVMARPAPPEEAEVLRTTWAVIEERFGLDGEDAMTWGARFFAISRRENHDAEGAAKGLADLLPERRAELWELMIAFLRDNELPEQHRSGRRGLERRLSELGFVEGGGAVPDWIEATLTLADSVYRATALDPEVMAGRGPVPREDVERWCGWVDVAATMRQRVGKLPVATITQLLVRLAEEEAGRVERSPATMPEPLARALASLRDQCLRPRWQRSRWALAGIDPLSIALARVASGEDSHAIRRDLEALAQEVTRLEHSANRPAPAVVAPPGGEEPARPAEAAETVTAPAETAGPREGGGAPAAAPSPDGRGLRASRFHLPPLPPVPPPRPAPRVRPRTDFPPMPAVPPPPRTVPPITREGAPRPRTEPQLAQPRPRTEPPRPRTEPQVPVAPRTPARLPSQRAAAAAEAPGSPPPRTVRARQTATVPHLVTPSQGNEFYDASFRELELIERDLVQRGPNQGSIERVKAIAAEAAELHAALGPSARSGDREFQAAQRRIDKVLTYVERMRPLLAPSGPREAGREGSERGGFWSRLLKKRR